MAPTLFQHSVTVYAFVISIKSLAIKGFFPYALKIK